MVQRGDASAPRGPTVTNLRLLLFGSGTFAIPSFVAMAAAKGIDIAGVITTAPHRAGRTGLLRRTPVALWAEGAHLPLLEVERIRDSAVVAYSAIQSGVRWADTTFDSCGTPNSVRISCA